MVDEGNFGEKVRRRELRRRKWNEVRETKRRRGGDEEDSTEEKEENKIR